MSVINRIGPVALAAASSVAFVVGLSAQAPAGPPNNGLPSWAYNVPDKKQPKVEEHKGPVQLPGSTKTYDAAETESTTHPPDWFPEEHPPAPKIITGEPGSTFTACGSCHLMSGQGHPESADFAGVPAEYFVRQMMYFKSGARKDPARMNIIVKPMSDADIKSAADYFSQLKPRTWVTVKEAEMVPRTYVSTRGRSLLRHPDGGMEPIGHRIVNIPEDEFRTLNRDTHSPFIAYVPPGSIKRGEELVKNGAGKTIQCSICHGDTLQGLGEVPRIAGMQPVYIARQLLDIQNGTSNGKAVALMKRVVKDLSEDDVIAISAYVGSLKP